MNMYIGLLFCNYTSAQEIFIVAYKGDIVLNRGSKLIYNFRYTLDRGSVLSFQIDASALIFTKDKYFTIEKMAVATDYSYTQLINRFNTTPAQKNNGFSSYLQKTHLYSTEVKESSKGSTIAGIKAIDNNAGKFVRDIYETIFPQDSAKLLANSIILKWEMPNKIFGAKLIVVNIQLNDTLYNSAASNKGEVNVAINKEGTYNWFLYSKMENKKTINRVFIKPNSSEVAALQNELEKFKNQTVIFSEELRALVLDDYLYQNHIVQ